MVARLDAQLQATRSQLADGKAEIERLSRLLRENAPATQGAEDGHAAAAGTATSPAPLEGKADLTQATGAATTGTTIKADETGRERTGGNAQEGRASTTGANRTSGAPDGAPVALSSKRPAASHAGGAKSKRRRRSTLQYIGAGAAGPGKDGGGSATAAAAEDKEERVRSSTPLIHPVFAKFEQAAKGMPPSAIARVVDTAREAGVTAEKIVACEKSIETAAAASVAMAAAVVENRDEGGDGDGGGESGSGEFGADEGGRKAEGGSAAAATAASNEEKAARMELEALVETRTGAMRILTKTPLDLMLAAIEVSAGMHTIMCVRICFWCSREVPA